MHGISYVCRMTITQRYEAVISYFRQNMPSARSELNFGSTYELIVAVMLSAQCTDKRVNLVTPALFCRYPDIGKLSEARPEELLELIRSISYPNSKCSHLIEMAKMVVKDFGGEIPTDVKLLETLPGVGHKTANVVASITTGAPVIAVDTHVFRVARRLGLSKGNTPLKVEEDLERHIEPELRPLAHHWLILHGRYVCTARKPVCACCRLETICPKNGL